MLGYIFSKEDQDFEVIVLGYSEQGAKDYVFKHYPDIDNWTVEVITGPTVIEREVKIR